MSTGTQSNRLGAYRSATTTLPLTHEAWMRDGLCRDRNSELWFPWSESFHDDVVLAKRVCAACPVRSACLDFALRHREGWGIWGGKTTKERARLLRDGSETNDSNSKRAMTRPLLACGYSLSLMQS
jgi:WhiB family redox-sensing transcriptional regulator